MFIFLHNIQIKEVHAMFYIDFTTPEGKTHRIDVIKNPVTYECPVCGEIHIYKFDPEYENWCWKCAERREEEERKKQTEQSYSYVANFLNQKFKTNYTPEDMKRFTQSPEYQKDPRQACKALIDQLSLFHLLPAHVCASFAVCRFEYCKQGCSVYLHIERHISTAVQR